MRKKMLEKRLARLEAKKAKLVERSNASQDAAEVRAMAEELDDLNAEIEETRGELDAIIAEEKEAEERSKAVPQGATLVNAGIVGAYAQQTNFFLL